MLNVWIVAGVVALVTGVAAWRRRRRNAAGISSEPVSGQWLAEARARGEEHSW